MNQKSRAFAVTTALLAASFATDPSVAQKQGGILKIYMLDSPASMSIHEERASAAWLSFRRCMSGHSWSRTVVR